MWRAYFRKLSLTAWKPELASRWDFFGIGIFNFKLDRKIPKISKFWVQDRDSEIPQDSEWESPKIPGIGVGIWKPRNTSKKSHAQKPENPEIAEIRIGIRKFWKIPRILSPEFRIFFSLEILIPGIRNFSSFRDFFPGFFSKFPEFMETTRDFYPQTLGFFIFGIFRGFSIPGIGIFFLGTGYRDKKPHLLKNAPNKTLLKIWSWQIYSSQRRASRRFWI